MLCTPKEIKTRLMTHKDIKQNKMKKELLKREKNYDIEEL